MELKDKVCIITGAASGIGASCARAFAAEGAKVVVSDINGEGAKAVAKEIDALGVACDVSSEAEIEALVGESDERLRRRRSLLQQRGDHRRRQSRSRRRWIAGRSSGRST